VAEWAQEALSCECPIPATVLLQAQDANQMSVPLLLAGFFFILQFAPSFISQHASLSLLMY
jgi:hypothetical protein